MTYGATPYGLDLAAPSETVRATTTDAAGDTPELSTDTDTEKD